MPLVPCPDCGKQHSDAATACPNCGRPTGASAASPDRPQIVKIQKRPSVLGIGCMAIIGLAVFGGIIGLLTDPDEDGAVPPPTTIEYAVLQEWGIPNGGRGRVVVIDSQYRTEEDLRAFGEQLRWEHRRDRHANIEVFDDERAAGMRDAALAEELNTRDMAHHDQHKVAFYQKNTNSGHHQLVIAADGVANADAWVTVPYPRP